MAETTSTKKLVPVQPAALRLPGRDSASRGHRAGLRVTPRPRGRTLYWCRLPRKGQRIRINTLTLGARLPTIYNSREYVELGSLLSYGPSSRTYSGEPLNLSTRFLRGAKPGRHPGRAANQVRAHRQSDTAKALGLKIPEAFLLRADEVIE